MAQMDPAIALARLTMMVQPLSYPVLPEGPNGEAVMPLLLIAARRCDAQGFFYGDASWTPTFDLNWAASEAFMFKAAYVAGKTDLSDGATTIAMSKVHAQMLATAAEYRKRSMQTPQNIRSQGQLIVNRQGLYSLIPWWYELAGN